MKKIFLLMLMLSPFASADMDRICLIVMPKDVKPLDFLFSDEDDILDMKTQINEGKCERNNILLLSIPHRDVKAPDTRAMYFQYASALWCRHDRNEKVESNILRCVLYDTEPRYIYK